MYLAASGFSDATGLLTAFAAVITVLLLLAGGIGTWAALRVGRNAQTLNNYRSAAESAQQLATAQEAEIRETRAENAKLRTELAALQGQVRVLRELVQSAIAQLAAPSNAQHSEVIEKLGEISRRLGGPE